MRRIYAYVMQTLRSTGDVKQSNLIRQPDGSVAFVVDFVGPVLKGLDANTPVAAQVSIGDNGEMVENTVRYNPVTKGWRLTLRVKVKDPKRSRWKCVRRWSSGDKPLRETWSYQLPANE